MSGSNPDTYNFVVLSQNSWFGPWMNRQHLFSLIGREHNVLYSSGAWFTWDLRREFRRGVPFAGGWRECDNVNVLLAPFYWLRNLRVRRYDAWVMRRFCKRLQQRLSPGKKTVLYIFHPDYADYIDYIDHDLLVFHAFDDYQRQAGFDETVAKNLQRLLVQSDIVCAVSANLQAQLASQSGRTVELVNNGVDYDRFTEQAVEPERISGIPHPRVGLLGNVNEKIDVQLLERLALARPDWHWIVIGGARNLEPAQIKAWSVLQGLSNVHLLGHQSHLMLPAYGQSMDCLLMCYRIDAALWTDAIYPLKLHEYLALGKPVVSSDIAAVREFSGLVNIANGEAQWLAMLDEILAGLGSASGHYSMAMIEARQQVARANQWSQRVDTLLDLVHQSMNKTRN